MNKTDRILTDVYIVLFVSLTILSDTDIMPAWLAGISPWLVPILFGAYFLYRPAHYYFVEKRVVYRCLLLVLASVVLIAVYG